uniref:OTU domain-containing protein n=1 Tax=Lactuca sativa TaxID=4236 RepID=A0A9R1V3F1_LACSA|nr:hypothetical protein LSAT_V11C700362630 [Lactuca sativa]
MLGKFISSSYELRFQHSLYPRVGTGKLRYKFITSSFDVRFRPSFHQCTTFNEIFDSLTKVNLDHYININDKPINTGVKKKLVESPTLNAYMQNYEDLQTLLFEYADVLDYLYTVWLGKYAERFVSLWIDKHVNFGNSTANIVESQHAKHKKHLESMKCDLDKFIRVIEKVVQSQEIAIKETFTCCIITYMPRFKDRIFEVLRKHVSVHAMDKILEELHRSKRFVPTPENCGCQLRTCFILPCAHELVMYVSSPPLDLIDAFWRKLDLKPSISVEYGDLKVDHRMQSFKEIYINQPDHIKYNYLMRIEEITDPSTNLINEPSEPPRYSSSFMDLNNDPARHSSFLVGLYEEPIDQCLYNIDLNEEPIWQCSYQTDLNEDPIDQCSYKIDLNEEPPLGHNSLLEEIPSIFHPYITHIQNVLGDGNCCFRSIAFCHGYGEDQWLYIR